MVALIPTHTQVDTHLHCIQKIVMAPELEYTLHQLLSLCVSLQHRWAKIAAVAVSGSA